MKTEFVTYNQALALKELGFEDGCLAQYVVTLDGIGLEIWNDENYDSWQMRVPAPLKQQCMKWFREKHGLYPEIGLHDREDIKTWRMTISILGKYELAYNQNVGREPYYKTYEEAEDACIDKLIQLIKEK